MRRPAQALVEFALSVSVFLLLVLGTVDLARANLTYAVVTNAVREEARYAAAHVGQTGWQASSVQAGFNLAVGVDTSALQLNEPTQQTLDGLPYISASGTYRFHSVTPLVGAFLGDPINIQVATSALAS